MDILKDSHYSYLEILSNCTRLKCHNLERIFIDTDGVILYKYYLLIYLLIYLFIYLNITCASEMNKDMILMMEDYIINLFQNYHTLQLHVVVCGPKNYYLWKILKAVFLMVDN